MKRWSYLLAVPLAFIQIPGPVAWAQAAPLPAALAPNPAPAAASSAAPAAAQNAQAAPAYSQAQLEQMLAPIALYPDDLLTQVLAASTYPLEIVMAERWLSQPANAALKGDALMKALDAQDWDPSVKSLIPFPTVLAMMNQQLDWTQQLGNAFLAQQADVFAAVQTLRKRAQAAGKLQSNAQQKVSQQPVSSATGAASQAIIIAPAQPDTVYVPVYNPTIVYGAWPYPAYPPVYYPPPAGYVAGTALISGIAFGAGVAIAGGLWGWGSPNWGRGNITVNSTRYNNINVNHNAQFNGNTWQHNPQHRRGTPYPNNFTRQQYQPNRPGNPGQRDAFRGRPTPVPNRPGQGQGQNRPNVNRPAQPPGGYVRPGTQGGQQNFRPQNAQRPQQRGGAFGGIDHGATTRAQMSRGQASRSAANPHWGGQGGGGWDRGGRDGGGRGGFGGGRRR